MKIITAIYIMVGIIGLITFSMLLLAQYNVVTNAYSIANKDMAAKGIGWMMLLVSLLFTIGGAYTLYKLLKTKS